MKQYGHQNRTQDKKQNGTRNKKQNRMQDKTKDTRPCIVVLAMLCLLSVCISGCGKKQADEDSAQHTLQMLSSPSYEGRLYGTKGNDEARTYLSRKLEEYGLDPFQDEYSVPFEAELPSISSTSLTISGKEEISFEEGSGYFSSLIMPLELSGTIPEDSGNGKEGELAVECEGGITLTFQISQFRVSNSWKISGMEEFTNLTVGVSSGTMEELRAHTGDTVTYRCEGSMETMELNNVMSVLKGKDSSRAIVLGAHFDHMGKIGEALYAGAVDNASGAAALLAACRELSQMDEKPDVDVAVCFWNAEEEGQKGSKAGASLIEERYEQYCYINLDCVGMIDGGNLQVTTANNSKAFCSRLAGLLEKAGCGDVEADGEQMTSDHKNFSKCPSVNIGQGDIMELIHTPQDTAEKVNSDQLELLARGLSEIVQTSASALLDTETKQQNAAETKQTYEERQEYIRSIERSLAYDEYMLIPDTGNDGSSVSAQYLIVDSLAGRYFDSLKDARKVYPKLWVKEQIGDYQLVQLVIYSQHMPADGPQEPGVPLKRLFSEDAILSVILCYENETRAFSYTQCMHDQGKTIKEAADMHRTEKLKGRKNAWAAYYQMGDQIPDEYIQKVNGTWYSLCQGSILNDSDGIFIGCANWKNEKIYTKKTLLKLGKMVRDQGKIIKILNN